MARLLLITSPELGHLYPFLGVAQWLRRDGHDVAFLLLPPRTPPPELGFPILVPRGLAPAAHVTGGEALARLVEDEERLAAWIRALLIDGVGERVPAVRSVLRDHAPDAVGLDSMLYPAVIAAHELGLPYLAVSSSLNPVTPAAMDCALTRTLAALAPERDALFEGRGVPATFRVADHLSPHGTAVFAAPEQLGGSADTPEGVRLVGPSIPPEGRPAGPPFPWEGLDGRPLVLASFGSQIGWQPERLALLAGACADLDLQLVAACGALAATEFPRRLPPGSIAVPFAPQLELLSRAAAFACHGGANSVMEARAAGVPVLLSPVCNDQHVQAYFLARAGGGRVLDLATATPLEVRTALRALALEDSPERRRAATIRTALRGVDGARRVAAWLVELAAST